MFKQLSATFIGLLLLTVGAKAAIAETVLEKISRTGTLTIGANLDNVPFSYINDKNEVVGYSIDLADRIRAEVASALGKDINLQIVEVQDISDALPKVRNGEVDLVCDTAFTWERDRYVDFTVSYAVAGMQLIVPKDTPITSREALANRKIALVTNTVVEDSLKLVQPNVQVVPVTSVRLGMEALREGKVDGVAGDGIQLAGLRQVLDMPNTKIVPESPEIRYGVGCMVREDNAGFLRLANYGLVRLAEGYIQGDPEDVEIVDKWIGPQGIVPVDNEDLQQFFNYLVITHEQVPEKSK
jgi:polar amino acid transport system substrate-binding protein